MDTDMGQTSGARYGKGGLTTGNTIRGRNLFPRLQHAWPLSLADAREKMPLECQANHMDKSHCPECDMEAA